MINIDKNQFCLYYQMVPNQLLGSYIVNLPPLILPRVSNIQREKKDKKNIIFNK